MMEMSPEAESLRRVRTEWLEEAESQALRRTLWGPGDQASYRMRIERAEELRVEEIVFPLETVHSVPWTLGEFQQEPGDPVTHIRER